MCVGCVYVSSVCGEAMSNIVTCGNGFTIAYVGFTFACAFALSLVYFFHRAKDWQTGHIPER